MPIGSEGHPLVAGDVVRFADWVGVLVDARDRDPTDATAAWKVSDGLIAGPTMWNVLAGARAYAATTDAILLRGETGTGKELAAGLIHDWSGRPGRYVRRNCAALPTNLAEGELFGWKRGAFTGAERDRDGYFALAHRGTLLLDEIDALEPFVQAKLLRAVQEGEIVRLGGTDIENVDVRVIAATHASLTSEQERGRFRADLYFRLATHVLELPPLRARREEIPILFRWFFEVAGGPGLAADPEFVERLCLDDWPGNVRELQSFAARARARAANAALGAELFDAIRGGAEPVPLQPSRTVGERRGTGALDSSRERVLSVMASGGNLASLARELHVSKDTLYRFLNRNVPGWRAGRDRARSVPDRHDGPGDGG